MGKRGHHLREVSEAEVAELRTLSSSRTQPYWVCKVFGMNITQLLYLDTNICPRHHSSTNTAKKAQH